MMLYHIYLHEVAKKVPGEMIIYQQCTIVQDTDVTNQTSEYPVR